AFDFLRRGGFGRRLQWEKHLQTGAFWKREHPVGDLVNRVLLDLLAADAAIGTANTRVQQAKVVVNFRGGGDGRSRVAGGVFLANGDGRGDAVNHVSVGFLDALEELARISRERLHIAALALGVNGVDRYGRLARPRDTRNHREGVMRDLQV